MPVLCREIVLVCEDFIASGCVLHTAHDHPAHWGIMGGLCGFWAAPFRQATGLWSLDDIYEIATRAKISWSEYGTDQDVLNRLCLSHKGLLLLEHFYAGWAGGKPYRNPICEPPTYGCPTKTVPVPDIGNASASFSRELIAEADRLADHLGAAGYDHPTASRFYDTYGNQAIAASVHAAEVLAGIRAER